MAPITYFSYTPDEYDYIWGKATRSLEDAIEAVREIYNKRPTTLTNGGTPESVGRSIWESVQEYYRQPTSAEIENLAKITNKWQFLSCEKGLVSDLIRKLIWHYRQTSPLTTLVSKSEKETLIGDGLDILFRCPQCNNDKTRKTIKIWSDCPQDTITLNHTNIADMKIVAVDWENAQRFCSACGWIENIKKPYYVQWTYCNEKS